MIDNFILWVNDHYLSHFLCVFLYTYIMPVYKCDFESVVYV